jgi:hypothetical protein
LNYAAQIEEALHAASFPQIPIIRSLVYEEILETPVMTLIIKVDPEKKGIDKCNP